MANERRSNTRLVGPFEGSWDGASGMRECRVTDLSVGGCFIDAYASQPVGASITVELKVNGQRFRLPAQVVYVDRVQGFAVKFLEPESAAGKGLAEAIAAVTP
ncbi:MAG: PilZ domain-containing protein [Vicinamibacterales bacterium]